MNEELKNYLEKVVNEGLEKNYWFMTKQSMTDFYLIFNIAKVVQTYKVNKNTGENFGAYYSRFFSENPFLKATYPKQSESENTYRNAIIPEFFGLINREKVGYDSAEITPAYKLLDMYIKSKEDVDKYFFLIERQIEKLCLNVNDKIQNYSNLSSVINFPVIFLYKVLYELFKATGDSTLYYDEFVVFLVRAKKYSDWQNTLKLILEYRQNKLDEKSKENFNKIFNDVTASNIRYDALLGKLSNIEYSKKQDRNYYKINDTFESKRYIENVIDIFESSKYVNLASISDLKKFLQSDKYFIGNLDGCFSIYEEKSLNRSLDENYYKFKNLISWFVKQIQINNKLIDGAEIYGQGYKNSSSIRHYYENWRDYDSFTLDCTLASGFQVKTKANYINQTDTSIDIVPNFDKEPLKLKSVSIEIKNNDEIPDDIATILDKEYLVDDLSLFDSLESNDKLKELFNDYVFIINKFSKNDETREVPVFDFNQCTELTQKGSNLVVYGTPGCGKSYYVEHTLLPESDFLIKADGTKERVIRTTFYQDYTNTDFVGQILPVIDGDKVTYKFNPGPFTLAMIEAIKNPNKRVALVIEELNRGNAPSIFGDVFQLLDRKDGISEYSIVNVNLIRYLNEVFNSQYKFEFIKIPTNLSIYATMNTSDQNVFTLDTAFKRRWEFIKLANTFKLDHKFKDKFIPGDSITWQELVTAINEYILANSDGYNSEDKQMGVYFVDESGMTSSIVDHKDMNKEEAHKFAYKIMEYLWDDVAKFQRGKWFKDDINSLDKLIDEYMKSGVNGVFKNGVIKKYE